MLWQGERKRAKPTRARLLDDGVEGCERGVYHAMVEWRGGGRTSTLAEAGRGESVGPRQGASRVEEGTVGYAGIIHHPRRREVCANTPLYHTTWSMVVEGCGVGGGGRPPTRNDRVRWRSWSWIHGHQRNWSYRGFSTYGWRRNQVIGVLRDVRRWIEL